jgi:hypothetical protein
MFEGIEHQQQLAFAQLVAQRVLPRATGRFRQAERVPDRRRERTRIPQRFEIDESGSMRKPVTHVMRGGQRERCLADSTWSADRQQTYVGPQHPLDYRGDLPVAIDQTNGVGWKTAEVLCRTWEYLWLLSRHARP